MRIINMIAGPRNISTAMMYSFSQRADTKVVDEPYYAHYLKATGINHPGRKEILKLLSADDRVIHSRILQDNEASILFLKNMGHHIRNIPFNFLMDYNNFFLIRNPKKIIKSFTKVIADINIYDIGLKDQFEQFEFLKKKGKRLIVIDSDTILMNPEKYLNVLCQELNIPFRTEMLTWPSGPKPEDGPWAKYWYSSLHKSTGFNSPDSSEIKIKSRYNNLLQEANSYYSQLKDNELT
jgi:hypothetical protein